MLQPYRDVLGVRGAPAFVVAGLVARLPISMLGLGIVLLYEATSGSYGFAGSVAAVFALVAAATSPFVARAVDRYGQARVMRPALAVHVAGIVGLVVASAEGAPRWTPYAAAVVSGATIGSIGALVRARWSWVLRGRPGLHTAYSLESVLDEVVFIVGPVLVTSLAVGVSPPLGLVAAAIAVGTGGFALFAQRSTEPEPSGATTVRGRSVLRSPGMVVLVVAYVFVGGVFGSVEVVTVAFTEERDAAWAAALVLAVFAVGSMLAGLGYGAVQWRWSSGRRFRLGVLLLAAGVAPIPLVDAVWLLAVVLFVAGFAISPMIIAGNGLVQELVAPARLTEGLTWVSTAIGFGLAGGAALSGVVIDAAGARTAFTVSVGAGILSAVVVLAGSRWLSPHPEPVQVAGGTLKR